MKPGRKEHKVYVYNKKGKRYKEFNNEVEFSKHFDLSTNYMAKGRKEYDENNIIQIGYSDFYACNKPVGRNAIKRYHQKVNSKFIKVKESEDKIIKCYNLDDELIATFKGVFYLRALLGHNVHVYDSKPKNLRADLYYIYK